jgi:ribosomal protein S18 acetylase RimI-like enzyme
VETKTDRIELTGEYMQIRDFTPEDYPALVAIHASLNIAWPERPRTPEAWAEADRNRNPKTKYLRLVAVEGERVVSFASYSHSPWNYPPGGFDINVEVRSDYQRRGIGSALYEYLMEDIQAFNPPALRADAFTNLPQGFAFLQKRGFYEAFRETPVHLDVSTFDSSPYVGLEPKLNSQGIFIKTIRELVSDPNRDRKIYDLMCAVDQDMPHEGDQFTEPNFEDWVGWGLSDPSVLQDAFLIAVCRDQYIGLRDLGSYGNQEALLGGLLGVRRDYRQRGIALAMQVHNIAYARDHGYYLLKDCTAIQNAPMQALFNRLGFTRDPEWQQCQKDFE